MGITKDYKEPVISELKFENLRKSIKPEDILNEKLILDGKTRRELAMHEKKNWRKRPTMRVLDMAENIDKALAENIYLAEKKYKYHREGKTYE